MATRLKCHQMVTNMITILIVVNQLINQVNSLAPQIKNLNVQCDANGMKVDVSFDTPFNGIVFSKGFYNDMNCRYIQEKSDSASLSFKIPADQCGTSIVRTDAKDSKQYENVIIFQNDPIYQEVWDSARLLSCRYLLERDLPLQEKRVVFKPFIVDMLDVITVPMADFAGDQHKVDCWMDVTKGRYPKNSPIDGPVKVGENLTLAIYIRDSRKRTDIRVKDCYAYDNEESVNNKSPALLQLSGEDGCPLKPKLMDIWKRTVDTGNSDATVLAYSTVTAFKFPEHSNVHLTCNVELCKNQCAERCSLETKGIEGMKEGTMVSGGDGDEDGEIKKSSWGSSSEEDKKKVDEDGEMKKSSWGSSSEKDKKKVDEDGEDGEGSSDVKPSSGSDGGGDVDVSPEKRDPKKSEGDDEDEDDGESKSSSPAPTSTSADDEDDEGDSASEKSTTTSKPNVKPESASSTKDDDDEDESSESDKGSEGERGGRKSDDDDEEDEDSSSMRTTSTTTSTTTTTIAPTTTTTTKPEDNDEEANEDEDEKPEPPSTTTSTTTEKPSGRSEDDEEDEEDDESDSSRKRSLRPSSKVEDKDEDNDDDAGRGGGDGNLSSALKAKNSLKQGSTLDDDEDYDDSQSSRGSSTSVSTTTTTPIPKTPLIIVIKPEKIKKKIVKEASPRTRGGRIETRSRQAVRSSSSSKLSSSSSLRSSSSRDSCCSDITSSSSSRSRTSTTTTTTKSPLIAKSSSSSSGRSVRRSSRLDEPEPVKRSKSQNRSNSERNKKQSRSSATSTTTVGTIGTRRTTTTTTTTKRPKRRSTTTTTPKPKTTTEATNDQEEDETEAPRKFRKSTRKPKRPVVRTRKSLTDRLFIPHTNERTSTSTTTSSTTVAIPIKPTTESSIVNRNSNTASTTVRIASNRFSTRRSNPYLRSTLKPATIPPPPPASSRNSLRSSPVSPVESSSTPPKRFTDFDEFKENEALIENEEINESLPKSRLSSSRSSLSSSSSGSSSSSSRRWDGDELFNPFKEIEYEPVRLNSKRNRRSIYNLFVNPANPRSDYIQ